MSSIEIAALEGGRGRRVRMGRVIGGGMGASAAAGSGPGTGGGTTDSIAGGGPEVSGKLQREQLALPAGFGVPQSGQRMVSSAVGDMRAEHATESRSCA
jgi:hypothetical protein